MKCREDLTTNLNERLFKKQKQRIGISQQTIHASSSEPTTPFHKIITIVNINVSQSSSRRPPSSGLVDEGTKNDESSVLVTPKISEKEL
jgi:hypothetical protein